MEGLHAVSVRRPSVTAPELALLCRVADPGAPAADLAARAAAVRDWPVLVARAERHGVIPLLDRFLASHPEAAPPAAAADVRTRARVEAMQSLTLAGELATLTERLERAGVPSIALKGPALGAVAYGDFALRPQMDVDVLVHPEHVDRALTVLAEAGYTKHYALTPGQEAAFRGVEYHHALVGEGGRSVELHWGIIKRQFALRGADALWWTGARTVSLGGRSVRTLSNEATMVYLAIHGGKHEWPHLRWIGDIAAVARLTPMDWEAVERASRALGTLRMTRLALALALDVTGASLPDDARRLASGDPAIAPLVAEIRERLGGAGDPAGFVASTRFQLAVRERASDKLAFVARHAVTPNLDDLQTADVPPAWRGVYFVLRPVRLARRWSAIALRRAG